MNNQLQIFNFEKHKVRTVFKDVCDVLNLSNSRRVSERLDDEKGVTLSCPLGGEPIERITQ